MKKLMYIFLALPILTGCKEKKSTGAMGGVPTPEISVTKPIVENITLTKDYPGYLTTEKTVNLVARVNGTLQSTFYVAGGRVKQGQLLFVIEPTLYKDQVEQAEAELKTAQAQLEYARNNYSRMKEAVKSDAVSQIHSSSWQIWLQKQRLQSCWFMKQQQQRMQVSPTAICLQCANTLPALQQAISQEDACSCSVAMVIQETTP